MRPLMPISPARDDVPLYAYQHKMSHLMPIRSDTLRQQRILLQGSQSTIFKTITIKRSKRSETDPTQLTNAAKRSETDPPKAQASVTCHISTWNCQRTEHILLLARDSLESSRETPHKTPCERLLARDSLRETSRKRLLGAGGECNNQPSTGVAKVMDRTAAGEG
jgi:hypothetical protein